MVRTEVVAPEVHMRRVRGMHGRSLCAWLLLILAGCGPAGAGAGGTVGGGGSGGTEPNCGVQDFTLTRGLPPELLIVLDKSGSMGFAAPSGSGSKWDQVTAAINSTVSQLQATIKFGLEFFPTVSFGCDVGPVAVPVAANNASAIASAITMQKPGGGTPTADGVYRGLQSLTGIADSNPKYIILATDGTPTCGATLFATSCACPQGYTQMSDQCCAGLVCAPCGSLTLAGPADAISAIQLAAQQGVHTFVIGVATGSDSDANLNQMAQAGMEQRAGGPPYYYLIGNQQELVDVINRIAGQIVSCNFALQMKPPYPEHVTVTADGQMVPRDSGHANGWDFGPGNMSIQFYGTYCASLQGGATTKIVATFGCPPVGIHR
jgi:von Willebrand factor type A domain